MWVETSLWWYIIQMLLDVWRQPNIMYSWLFCKCIHLIPPFFQTILSIFWSLDCLFNKLMYQSLYLGGGRCMSTALCTSGAASQYLIWVWTFSPCFSWLNSPACVQQRSAVYANHRVLHEEAHLFQGPQS